MRTLLIFIALAIIVAVARQLWLQPRKKQQRRRQLTGKMVQCSHCGMYIPEQEALREGDRCYCSREHLDAERGVE